ncbi:MAG: hypothetical protein ACM3O7_07190 [Acidobacteriota bacterium]
MSSNHGGDVSTRFEDALRGWGGGPPRIDAGTAARRVLARLPERTRPLSWWRMAAAAGAVALLFIGAWYGARSPSPPHVAASRLTVPPLPDNVMVFWLDSETPVYFVLSPLGSEKGDAS